MTTVPATNAWSDEIVIAAASLLQAQGGPVAVSNGAAAPADGEPGTILGSGDTVLFGPGSLRIRRIGNRPATLHYQTWP